MKLSKKALLVSAAFLLSASSGFALGVDRDVPALLAPPGYAYCSNSSQCNESMGGDCCAIVGPEIEVCAPRDAGRPCLDL